MLETEQYINFISTIPSMLPTNPHFCLHYISIYNVGKNMLSIELSGNYMLEPEQYINFISTIPSMLPTNPHFCLHYISIYDAQLRPLPLCVLCKYCIMLYLKIPYNFTFA